MVHAETKQKKKVIQSCVEINNKKLFMCHHDTRTNKRNNRIVCIKYFFFVFFN